MKKIYIMLLFIGFTVLAMAGERPAYSLFVADIPASNIIGPVNPTEGEYTMPEFLIRNDGTQAITCRVETVVDGGPDGTMVTFCDDYSCYPVYADITLEPGEVNHLHGTVYPTVSGEIRFHIAITAGDLIPAINVPFNYITNDTDLLVVNDAGNYDDPLFDDLRHTSLSWGSWDISRQKLSDEARNTFSNLLWYSGDNTSTLDTEDRTWLQAWLQAGKSAWLSGNYIGSDLAAADNAFLTGQLHCSYAGNSTATQLEPVVGGPFEIIYNPPLHNGQYNCLNPEAGAETSIYYAGNQSAAICHTNGNAKLSVWGFAYGDINDYAQRKELLAAALNWYNFNFTPAPDSHNTATPTATLSVWPNPAKPGAALTVRADGVSGNASVRLFDARGRQVLKQKVSGNNAQTSVKINRNLPSGVYFVAWQADNVTVYKKTLIIK